ncbi:MAG: GFA family protein [Candidatus Sericytochromatia bacterium]|nr:GFA family protein [Candidatus Tanganyikabacteria bacterium]
MTLKPTHKGSCLCGAVTFSVSGDLPPPDACHCTDCWKHSGHFFVSTDVPRSAVVTHGEENLTWYKKSDKVRLGFCSRCGSSLFWDPIGRDWIGVAMGAFDTSTGTRIGVHVHVVEKGDYYDIADGVPQHNPG